MERPLTIIANFIESNLFNYNHRRIAAVLPSRRRNNKHRKITGSFLNARNCNFLPKSNDYRHKVEFDNARKEKDKKKHIAKDPQAPQERIKKNILQTENQSSLAPLGTRVTKWVSSNLQSPALSLGQWLGAWRIEFLTAVLEKELMGIWRNGKVLRVKAAKH